MECLCLSCGVVVELCEWHVVGVLHAGVRESCELYGVVVWLVVVCVVCDVFHKRLMRVHCSCVGAAGSRVVVVLVENVVFVVVVVAVGFRSVCVVVVVKVCVLLLCLGWLRRA